MSHSVPDKQTIANIWQAVKDRSVPVKGLTKAEYDVLDAVQKNADVVYVVEKPGESPKPTLVTLDEIEELIASAISEIEIPTVEEYDTDDGWHVRKYSDGYVELLNHRVSSAKKGTDWTANGNGYLIDNLFPAVYFPFRLTKRYTVTFSFGFAIDNINTYGAIPSVTTIDNDPYIKVPGLAAWRFTKPPDQYFTTYSCDIVVTGRWK